MPVVFACVLTYAHLTPSNPPLSDTKIDEKLAPFLPHPALPLARFPTVLPSDCWILLYMTHDAQPISTSSSVSCALKRCSHSSSGHCTPRLTARGAQTSQPTAHSGSEASTTQLPCVPDGVRLSTRCASTNLVGHVVVEVECMGPVHRVGNVWAVASCARYIDGVPWHPEDLARAGALHEPAHERPLLIIEVHVMSDLLLLERRKKRQKLLHPLL